MPTIVQVGYAQRVPPATLRRVNTATGQVADDHDTPHATVAVRVIETRETVIHVPVTAAPPHHGWRDRLSGARWAVVDIDASVRPADVDL